MAGSRAYARPGAAGFAVLLAACLLLAVPVEAQAAASERPWRVVLLRSWDALYAINLQRERGMRAALLQDSPRSVDFYTEEIDPLRFDPDIESQLATLLRHKYEATPVDVVIASGLEPLQFAGRYRDAIWPGVPIVFYGVFEGMPEVLPRPPRSTGVTGKFDVAATAALGLALVPDARRLYLIAGTAEYDRLYLEHAKRELARSPPGLEVAYIVGASRAEVLRRVESVEDHALVMYLSMLRDGIGNIAGPDAASHMAVFSHSRAPAIAAAPSQWRRGGIGGVATPLEEHGRAAGRLVRRVLQGEDADSIPVATHPTPICEVDWTALQRWRIPDRLVPPNCTVVNVPVPLWKAYLGPFVLMAAVIVLQFALLWSLFLQIRKRRLAEVEAHDRGVQMARVSRLSTVGALTASIAHEINQPMGAILSNAEAAETMLEQGTLQTAMLRDILKDIRTEDLRASEVIKRLRKLLSNAAWNPVPLEVNAEVAEALRHVAFSAARSGVTLLPRFDPDTPAILGDPLSLQQVVINLVMNAMQALNGNASGSREVRIETHAAGPRAEIIVADEGPGLTPEDEARVFHSPFTTRKDGMGFGLSIVKTIVELHGGTVSYEPNKPRGATFRVRLPAIGT